MADLTPIPMGIPWDPSLPHSHAHLYSFPLFSSIPSFYSALTRREAAPSNPARMFGERCELPELGEAAANPEGPSP